MESDWRARLADYVNGIEALSIVNATHATEASPNSPAQPHRNHAFLQSGSVPRANDSFRSLTRVPQLRIHDYRWGINRWFRRRHSPLRATFSVLDFRAGSGA